MIPFKRINHTQKMATSLRISTMTALCNMGCLINLQELYDKLEINDTIQCIEYQDKPIKGIKKKKKKKNKKCFYNQMTLIINILNKNVNVKVFKNGRIQITGIKSEENGKAAAEYISSCLKDSNGISDYKTVLINSDFNIGFPIHREKLYYLLVDKYKLFVTFEPCIYPGVNAKYYWNQSPEYKKLPGVCICTKKCNGKGCGEGESECKRITMSTFQSGTIIITGANTKKQLYDVYEFISRVIIENRIILEKKESILKKLLK